MSRNSTDQATPKVVLCLADAVSRKLGRPSYVRKAKNRNEWFLTDLLLSYVQHGLKVGVTGYRIGYFFDQEEDILAFYLVHSPITAKIFKNNLHLSTLVSAVEETKSFRKRHYLFWSSISGYKEGFKITCIDEQNYEEFVNALRNFDRITGFKKDLFPNKVPRSRKVQKWAGNDFGLLLAEDAQKLTVKKIETIVDASWPLFLCLYPIRPIENRNASLARSLRSAKLERVCEFHLIKGIRKSAEISQLCRGEVEGAHIKPHALGGSDRMENGLWLCQYHHRATEGKLIGSRSSTKISVRFTSK